MDLTKKLGFLFRDLKFSTERPPLFNFLSIVVFRVFEFLGDFLSLGKFGMVDSSFTFLESTLATGGSSLSFFLLSCSLSASSFSKS